MRKDSLALLTFCPFVPCLVLKTLRFDGLGTLFCSREAPGYLTDVHLTIACSRPPSFFWSPPAQANEGILGWMRK